MPIQTINGEKIHTGCFSDTCDDALPSTVGVTATSCYKTKVCSGDAATIDKEAISGSVWTVDYYNQQVDNDDALTPLDGYVSPVFQNYVHISNMPIVQENDITISINELDGSVDGTGQGRLINLFRPFVGDVIIGPYGTKTYLWKITSVIPTNIGDGYGYDIQYTLMSEVSDTNQDYNSLLDKVLTDLVFDINNGLMTQEDVDNIADLNPFLTGSLKRYMDLVAKNGDLMLSANGQKVYDPAMTSFVKSIIPSICANLQINQIPMTSTSNGPNVLDGLLNRDEALVSAICRRRCLTSVSNITTYSSNALYALAQTDYVVGSEYDIFPDTSRDLGCGDPFPPEDLVDGLDPNCMPLDAPCCGCSLDPLNDVNSNYGRTIEIDDGVTTIIKDPVAYETYIFSPAYYDGIVAEMSYFERLVYKYMHNEEISVADLLPVWKDVLHWCSHSWFYYMPILTLLSKYALEKRGDCVIPVAETTETP